MDSIEKCVIGELWLDTNNAHIHSLKCADFKDRVAGSVFNILYKYQAIRNDIMGIRSCLEMENNQDKSEITAYLLESTNTAVSVSLLPQHIRIIKNRNRREAILEMLSKSNGNLTNGDIQALHRLTEPESAVEDKISTLKTLALDYGKELETRIERYKNGMPYPTGFRQLDSTTGGIMEHEIFVIGGRTSLGKSAMLINIGCNLAEHDIPVLYFSCEMSDIDILDRVISQKSNVEAYKIKFGKVDKNEICKIQETLGKDEFYAKPFWICYSPSLTVNDIRMGIERVNPKIIIVDHIQLLKLPGDNEAQEMSKAMYELKRIAGEYNVGIVCASQLNRDEVNNSAKLTSNNFKGSGGIEEAAAVACKIKMSDESQKEESVWDIDFEVTKNRHGQIGRVLMSFNRPTLKFTEKAKY